MQIMLGRKDAALSPKINVIEMDYAAASAAANAASNAEATFV